MGIFLMILLAVLPLLLQYLLPLIKKKGELEVNERTIIKGELEHYASWLTMLEQGRANLGKVQLRRLDKAKKLFDQTKAAANQLGCNVT